MRDAARALDDVSDHLGEVLRRADDLLAEWGKFGAQVRDQVEREAAAIGEVVDGAVGRAAATGIDRAIGDRLRALTAELERLEQRARAASRAAAEQREADSRLLWAVVAGIVLANALLVVLILRKPAAAPVAEPVRIDAAAPSAAAAAGSATPDPASAAAASQGAPATEPAGSAAGASVGSAADKPGAGQGATAGSAATTGSAAMIGSAATAGSGAARPAGAGSGAPAGTRPVEAGARPPVAPPARSGAPHPHKKP
ncbi:MAG TPA: hypothetical protein VHT91_34215 [Kofleriaceae bacterium]|jgi:hypothetical protein|nr:hypothetical protein [Kofleriaceae bacterium]